MVLQARGAEVLHQVEAPRAVAAGLPEGRRHRGTEDARSAVLAPERLEVRVDGVTGRRHGPRRRHHVRGRHEVGAQGSRHDRAAWQQEFHALEVLRTYATLRGIGELLSHRIADQTSRLWLALTEGQEGPTQRVAAVGGKP